MDEPNDPTRRKDKGMKSLVRKIMNWLEEPITAGVEFRLGSESAGDANKGQAGVDHE